MDLASGIKGFATIILLTFYPFFIKNLVYNQLY